MVEMRSAEPDLVEGLIASDSLLVFAGDSKAGKSMLLTDLAMHVASGRDWLGLKVRKSTVLWLTYEESHHERHWAYSFYPEEKMEGVLTVFEPPAIDTSEGVSQIKELIEEHRARLVIIDPLAAATDSDNFDNVGEGRAKLKRLKTLAADLNVSIVVVHHLTKPNAQGGGGRKSISGSHQIVASASGDVVMTSTQTSDGWHIRLSVVARRMGRLTIEIVSEGIGKYRLAKPEERKSRRKREGAEQAILGVLEKAKGEVTQDTLISRTNYGRSSVSKALSKLVTSRRVEARPVGRSKNYALVGSKELNSGA